MQTDRIYLMRWLDSDASSLYKYASDPDVGPRAGWPPHQSIEESLTVIRDTFTNDTTWAIVLKETGEAIGAMGYFTHATSNISIGKNDCEVGYWVAKPYWNQGICTEALRLMLDYCINEKHFENIWSDHFTGNPASGRVMEKCGFKDTGRLNRCSNLLGGDKDMVRIYELDTNVHKYGKETNIINDALIIGDNNMCTIEIATIDDVPTLLDLQHKAFGPQCIELGWEDAPPMTETLEHAYEEFAQCLTLKIQSPDGKIIGSIRGNVTDGSLYMGRLMVNPDYRQQGLGKRLFYDIQARLPHKRAWLCTCQQVAPPYEFYLRQGFTPYKSEEVGHGLTWVFMEKYNQ